MEIIITKFTDAGGRPVNEDTVLFQQDRDRCYFALADGLGGHGNGDVASQTVCKHAMEVFPMVENMDNDMFKTVFQSCQKTLLEEQKRLHKEGSMRTTLNLLATDSRYFYWSHVGDSRTYYFKDGRLIKRTFDHSVPQMLAAMGEIQENEIRFHEDRNRLLRVLGVEDQTPAFENEEPIPFEGNQQFLMCSDGFWELIDEEAMLKCLSNAADSEQWMDQMLAVVRKNAEGIKTDNITALSVWIR